MGATSAQFDPLGRDDLSEVDVKPVRAEEQIAGAEVRLDLARIDFGLDLIRQEDIHQVAGLGGFGGGNRLETVAHGGRVVRRARPLSDHDRASRVSQVLGLRVALTPIADHRDRLSLEQR